MRWPGAAAWTPRELVLVSVVLASCVAALVAFAVLDGRSPDDHDPYFANDSIVHALALQEAADGEAARAVLVRSFLTGGPHPRLGPTVLVASLGFGELDQAHFRLSGLPFLLSLVLGTWLLGRELGGARVGVLASWFVCTAPLMVQYSRKFAPPWHAAGLTPLAWVLLLWAVRLRGGRALGAMIAAGLVQGMRAYVHPIVYPEIALSTSLVGLLALALALEQRSARSFFSGLRVVGAGLLGLLLASHVLGWTARWVPEPPYSLDNYVRAKGHIVVGSWWKQLGPMAGACWAYLWDWFVMHLFPVGFGLAAVGGLGAAVALARRASGWQVGAALLLALLAQAPLAVLAVSRGTFTSDWMLLVPSVGALAAWGACSWLPTRGARAWAALAAGHGALVLAVPLALSLWGPEPQRDPGAYRRGVAAWFARSTTGGLYNTHHIPLRSGIAGPRFAPALAERGAASLQLTDLTWHGERGAAQCRVSAGSGGFRWGPPSPNNTESREWSRWPFLFAGYDAMSAPARPQDDRDGAPPRAGDARARWITDDAGGDWAHRPTLVRLWVQLDASTYDAWMRCRPSVADESLLTAAEAQLRAALPGAVLERFWDLGGEFFGMENEIDREPSYLHVGLLAWPPEEG